MKRDMELVRKILFAIEECDGYPPTDLQIAGYDTRDIGYHIFILNEAGLVEATDSTHCGSDCPQAIAVRLTWIGHEFLDAARNDSIWTETTRVLKPIGGAALPVWIQLLTNLALEKLGNPV